MATDLCAELSPDRRTILDIPNQKRSVCGIGACDPILGATSNALKRGRYARGAHACTLVTGANGRITLPAGSEVFGTAGQGDAGTPMGLTWVSSLTYSDTDFVKGGAFQQKYQFLIVGISVEPQGTCQVVASGAAPANTEFITSPLARQANGYDRILNREFFNRAHLWIQTPDTECVNRISLLAELPFSGGARNKDLMTNGGSLLAQDFAPLMTAYCSDSSLRNQSQFTVEVDQPVILANGAGPGAGGGVDPVDTSTHFNGAGDTTLNAAVYIRYALFFYGLVISVPEASACGAVSLASV